MKGQVHIAFHYNENRLNILKTVIKSWEDETDIIVHTNKKSFDIENVKIIEWPNLSHPFLLTIVPAFYIKYHFDDSFDFFVYLEDDIVISRETFEYWKRYQTPDLGFLRVADDGVLCDIRKLPEKHGNVLIFNQLYKAFWIYTKDQMKKYLDILPYVFQNEIITNINWSRERAAFGMWMGPCFIPINELKYAFVKHLGYKSENMPHDHIKEFVLDLLNYANSY